MIRLLATTLFFASFGLWLAADTYVGLNDPESIAYRAVFAAALATLSASAWRSLRHRRLEWQVPLIALGCVIGMQIVWRDLIHVGANFKAHAALATDALPVIVALGILAMALEWWPNPPKPNPPREA